MPAVTSGTSHKPTKGKSCDIFRTVFFFEISGFISLPLYVHTSKAYEILKTFKTRTSKQTFEYND